MSVQFINWHFGTTRLYRIQNGVVYENILIFRLHHIITLRSNRRHATVHVYRTLVPYTFHHTINYDERSGSSYAGAKQNKNKNKIKFTKKKQNSKSKKINSSTKPTCNEQQSDRLRADLRP